MITKVVVSKLGKGNKRESETSELNIKFEIDENEKR